MRIRGDASAIQRAYLEGSMEAGSLYIASRQPLPVKVTVVAVITVESL